MATDKKPTPSENKSISIGGDVKDSVVISGDNNTVNQTFTSKSDAERLELRDRPTLLNHVENAWIKGVLAASLHGAVLLDLGIKQDPEAVTKSLVANKKILPAGTSMLEIFDSIGMGRSLLILGAPGSGKTTMLLELARGLIAQAREDITKPIPMVFNLASWTEKLSLVDWLAQELNNLYSVPRKTAPDWVKENKLLLLLDGLDEVRQESRAKCVEAINEFRNQNGLTSLAVCSRSQDYADLKEKLAFEGAINIQPLTQEQIAEFFNRFGDEMTGIKQALEKDNRLREMAEIPLFLSIMLMAYRNKQVDEIPVFADMNIQRKYIFDHYIERIFDRYQHQSHKFELKLNKATPFKKQDVLYWLSWLGNRIIKHNQVPYLLEDMQPGWLNKSQERTYKLNSVLLIGVVNGLLIEILCILFIALFNLPTNVLIYGVIGILSVLIFGLLGGFNHIELSESLKWNWKQTKGEIKLNLALGSITGISMWCLLWVYMWNLTNIEITNISVLTGLCIFFLNGLRSGLTLKSINQTISPGQKIYLSVKSYLTTVFAIGIIFGFFDGIIGQIIGQNGVGIGLAFGITLGLILGLFFGGNAILQHYTLRFILARNNLLPWRLVPFLNHCVDLIFLRRVGGGYIFVHRLLMEHFAEMYVENPTSKGN